MGRSLNNQYHLQHIGFDNKRPDINTEISDETVYITADNVNEIKNVVNGNTTSLENFVSDTSNNVEQLSGIVGSESDLNELLHKVEANARALKDL